MRIKQLYSNFGDHFAEALAKKYSFTLNNSPQVKMDEPLFMFGCYSDKHIWRALHHNSGGQLTVICWAGSDASNLKHMSGIFNRFPNIKHIAISKWIAADLGMQALPYHRIPITPHDFSDIKPEPLGDSIYMYKPDSRIYNGGIYEEVKKRLPEYNFIEVNWGDHTRNEMMDIYKKCFIGLRFTEHDGLSNTVCEMGMMGRMVINNGEVPNCIPYNDIDRIITSITDRYTFTPEYVSNEVKEYLNIGDLFLNTEFYQ